MSITIIDNNNIFQKDVIGNVRTAQEDSHDIAALTPNGDVFVVCDGMGGHVGGKQASSIAVRSIIEYLGKERYPQPEQALDEALQFANMQILGYANEHPELKGMGTTACIVLLQDSEAYIAHVGDSRIYLYLGKEKQLHRITKDHSFVQTLVDAGQITDEEAEHHPNKNRILKALGIKPDLVPSFGRVLPKNGDVFLICSDGLSGMVPDSVIRDVLMQNTSIEHKGETLINLALEAGGLDNITLELINVANSPHPKSRFRSYSPAMPDAADKGPKQQPARTISKWMKVALIAFAVFFCLLCGVLIYGNILKSSVIKKYDEFDVAIENRVTFLQRILQDYPSELENKKEDCEKYMEYCEKCSSDMNSEKQKLEKIPIYNLKKWKEIIEHRNRFKEIKRPKENIDVMLVYNDSIYIMVLQGFIREITRWTEYKYFDGNYNQIFLRKGDDIFIGEEKILWEEWIK